MAITRSGRGRPFPVDNQPYPASRGRGRGRCCGRVLIRHRSPSLPLNPTPNQHRQEEEELVRNQLVPEEQESIMEEEVKSVESLIESLQKEYLVALVMEAISNDTHLIERVRNLAEVDPAQTCPNLEDMEKLKIAPSISNRYLGKQRAEPTLPLSSERPCGRQRGSHPIGLATSMSGAYSPLFGAPQRFLLVAIAQLQSSNPRMGCILRCQYKLPENQYATTSSTTEEEEKPQGLTT
ncbi:unnamed protein product [Camellia sinensis]